MTDQRATTLSGVYDTGVFRLWAPANARARRRSPKIQDPNGGQPPPIPAETTLWIDATVELSVFDPDFAICDHEEQSVFDPLVLLKSIQPAALRYLTRPFWKQSRLGAAIAGFILTALVSSLVLLAASGNNAEDHKHQQQHVKMTVPATKTATQAKQVAITAPTAPVDVEQQVRPAPQTPAVDPQLKLKPIVITKSKAKTRKKRARSRRFQRHRRSRRASASRVNVDALLRAPQRTSRSVSRPRSRVDVDAILLAGAGGS